MTTILLGEAEKKGVKLTDEERKKREAEFLKSIAGRPGAPKSIDELLAQHPFGKERARKEFDDSLVIQKLIEQEVTSKIKVDEKKVAEQFAIATSNYTAAVKAAAGAEGKIKDLKKQLDGLKGDALTNKFAQLAKEHSDCPSKNKGGDLGPFTRGQMVPEFDKVAFSSEPLVVSDPVKTQFGWHLVMVTKKTPAVEAKGDKAAEPEKVQASHILVSARAPEKAPTKEEVEAQMKRPQEQMAMQAFVEKLRAAAKIEAPDFPSLQPPKPEAPKAAAPKKAIESKPVEAKPAEAKPAEAPKPAAKPAEARPSPRKRSLLRRLSRRPSLPRRRSNGDPHRHRRCGRHGRLPHPRLSGRGCESRCDRRRQPRCGRAGCCGLRHPEGVRVARRHAGCGAA